MQLLQSLYTKKVNSLQKNYSSHAWLGQVRLSWLRLGQVRLGWVRLGWARLVWVRLGWARLGVMGKKCVSIEGNVEKQLRLLNDFSRLIMSEVCTKQQGRCQHFPCDLVHCSLVKNPSTAFLFSTQQSLSITLAKNFTNIP